MSEENIENIKNIAKSDSNLDHNFIPDIYFNGHCLIKNNISILKKVRVELMA